MPTEIPALRPGFTLLEILVSMVVLAIGCLAALSMQTSTMERGAQAYNLTVASFLAESEIERLKSMSPGRAQAVSSAPVRLTRDGAPCPTDGSLGPCYIRTTTVVPRVPTSQSLWVSVKIEIPGPAGTRSLTYDTLIFYLNFV
jgi:type IV pilus modification protein PilV